MTDVEKLRVFQRAVEAADEIFAITKRPGFARYTKLRDQLRESASRIEPQLLEGSAQATDRHYAHFVTIARGSAKEVKGHLRRALRYELISKEEYQRHWKTFDEIAAMLTGLKHHLEGDDWKHRG